MLNELSKNIYEANKAKGFWDEREEFRDILNGDLYVLCDEYYDEYSNTRVEFSRVDKALRSEALMLIVSELSEALEAIRKDLMDDKLPEYKGEHVELVDALIRILDYAGGYGVDLDTILEKKLSFNATRPYKHGKTF